MKTGIKITAAYNISARALGLAFALGLAAALPASAQQTPAADAPAQAEKPGEAKTDASRQMSPLLRALIEPKKGPAPDAVTKPETAPPAIAQSTESKPQMSPFLAAMIGKTGAPANTNTAPAEPVTTTNTSTATPQDALDNHRSLKPEMRALLEAGRYSEENLAVGVLIIRGKDSKKSPDIATISKNIEFELRQYLAPSRIFAVEVEGKGGSVTFFVEGEGYGPSAPNNYQASLVAAARDLDAISYVRSAASKSPENPPPAPPVP